MTTTTHEFPKRRAAEPPALVLGAMNFGSRTPAPEAERITRRALERGILYYDTANSYNAGQAEIILGRALGKDRERVVLSTKCGLGVEMAVKREGLTPEAMRKALPASLERLGTDYVDLYYLHVPDRAAPIEASLDTMAELVASGKVKAWATSNYASWEILEMRTLAASRGLAPPAAAQALYNVLHRQLDVEYFAFTRRYPQQTIAYNALAGGLLSGRYAFDSQRGKESRFEQLPMYQGRYWTKEMFSRVEEVTAVAKSEGLSLVELAYAWLASRPDVDAVLVGPGTVEHLDEAIDAIARPLSPDARKKLDELNRGWIGSDTNYAR
jgi:aryl-alcohol dehydrogenase-like predicted oxidoreductase